VDPIVINNAAYELAANGSWFASSYTVYTVLIGNWFWAILWLFLLIVTFIRTEDLTYVFVYGMLGMLGLGAYGLFPQFFKPIVYLILAISLMLTLYAFYVRNK
jgi:hypothetical protein